MNWGWGEVAVAAVIVRVFAADITTLGRRMLGAGVRVGAAEIARERREMALPTASDDPTGED